MANAAVDICNTALTLLGEGGIAALEEESEAARVCRLMYDPTRRGTLLLHEWCCATGRLDLARLDPPGRPAERWAFCYGLPADCLKARRIETPHPEAGCVPFALGVADGRRVLFTNHPIPTLAYTVDITDTTLFSAAFEQAFAHRLAGAICLTLTGSDSRRQMIAQLAAQAVATAVTMDRQEGYEPPRRVAEVIKARSGWGR